MCGYVYILRSLRNGRFYIGSTNDLSRRITEHNNGRGKYTSLTIPFELIFSQKFETLAIARKIEYKLKQFKSKRVIINIVKSGKIEFDQDFCLSW